MSEGLDYRSIAKYLWIKEQLKRDNRFKFSDYCEKFHADRCCDKDFKSKEAFDFIDKIITIPDLGLSNLIKPLNKKGFIDKHGYYVLSAGVIESVKFSSNENLMKSVINKIARTQSINPFFSRANDIGINDKLRDESGVCDKIIYKTSEYENFSQPETLRNIREILDAFSVKRKLRFKYFKPGYKYKNGNRRYFSDTVTPLRIVNYQGQWYLFCISRFGGGTIESCYKYYKIARIKEIKQGDKYSEFELPEVKNTLLNERFGIGTGGDSKIAAIKFTGYAAETISEVKWHEDQELIFCENDNSQIMKIKYSSNLPYELVGRVLQHGGEAEILEPADLREMWKSEIIKMYQKIM